MLCRGHSGGGMWPPVRTGELRLPHPAPRPQGCAWTAAAAGLPLPGLSQVTHLSGSRRTPPLSTSGHAVPSTLPCPALSDQNGLGQTASSGGESLQPIRDRWLSPAALRVWGVFRVTE